MQSATSLQKFVFSAIEADIITISGLGPSISVSPKMRSCTQLFDDKPALRCRSAQPPYQRAQRRRDQGIDVDPSSQQ